MVLLVVAALLCGCANTPAETPTTVPHTEPKYASTAKLVGVQSGALFDFKQTEDGYTVAQGAATDGTYGYFALVNTSADIDGEYLKAARIVKVDLSTWGIVKTSDPIRTFHSNGMTHNSKTNKLLVVHNKQEFQNISRIHCRWRRPLLSTERSRASATARSGDDEYIYMLDSGVQKMPGYKCFTVCDWSGKYMGVYRLPSMQESDALPIVGDAYYVTFFNGSGGRRYELQFDAPPLGNYQPN